jgi:hypothetical protein
MMMVSVMTVVITANPENAIDATDGTADTGADRATDHGAHWACRTATVVRALISAAFHAADDTLCLAGMWDREQGEHDSRDCKLDWQTV